MVDVPLGDGITTVSIDGSLDPGLPLVVLLHGLGGSSLDMTDPITAYPTSAFDRAALFPGYSDAGFHPAPPAVPVDGFFLDPPLTTVTSWREALLAAGFSTVTYTQSGATIAPNVTQLATLATGPLTNDPRFSGLRIAFVAHSRGGLVARAFLVMASSTPTLAPFLSRVTTLITLHAPNDGSTVANSPVGIAALLSGVINAFIGLGLYPPGFLLWLFTMTQNPAITEMRTGSPTLLGIIAGEPVPGITYHTFGGTSTIFSLMFASVFTPDSSIPLPLPVPIYRLIFHWGTTPDFAGAPLDPGFTPVATNSGIPGITALVNALQWLANSAPEVSDGSGDGFVADTRAHLPFAASRTTNALNHNEALWDPALQAQVVAILARLRLPIVSGQAITRISPFPVSPHLASYVVTASDAVGGQAITQGTVIVRDTFGNVALTTGLGSSFWYAFAPRQVIEIVNHHRIVELVYPTVTASLNAPYSDVDVDLGVP